MHIGFWSPGWPLENFQNGIVTYVHWMKFGLESLGHRVSIFTPELHPGADGRSVYPIRPRRLDRLRHRLARHSNAQRTFDFSTSLSAGVLRVHRRDPLDILEMEESFGWFADVGRRTPVPVVVKLHGPAFLTLVGNERESPFAREKIAREGQALRAAAIIVSPSQGTLDQTMRHYQINPLEKRRIVNPLALEPNTPLWDLDACDRDTILFVGRFDLIKGADVLLQAFASLVTHRAQLKLIFVGPDRGLLGADGALIFFADYRDRILPPRFRQSVEYRGPLGNREIAGLRARALVTVVASRWESQGYTLLEAMLQGCPVVTTNAGACPESVIHRVTGRLAKSEDANALAAEIVAMLDDPAGAARMGRAARQHVINIHSPAQVAAEAVELYRKATTFGTHLHR